MSSLVSRGSVVGRLLPRLLRCSVTQSGHRATVRPVLTCLDKHLEERRWFSASVKVATEDMEASSDQFVRNTDANQSSAWEEAMDRKLYMIDMDVRRTGRTATHSLEHVLDIIRQSNRCTSNQALLILRCCGSVMVDLSCAQRNTLLAGCLAVLGKVPGLHFDVSHYNAVLKVHIENENNLVSSDFLSEMEQAEVVPNRVTFQHLVGLYCQAGNIGGATTVLEHMKDQEMAINETVFLSLLRCHCLNLDHGSVTSTLQVMVSSGLLVGAQTFAVMGASYGQAGAWDKVQEILAKAGADDVKLSDGDMFSVILGCCKGGLEKHGVAELLPLLLKKAGYFQEMRNAVPQLIHTGAIDTAVEVFIEFPSRHDMERDDKGKFVFQALARADVAPAKILDAMSRIEQVGYNHTKAHLLESAVELGTADFCVGIEEELRKADIKVKNIFPESEYVRFCSNVLKSRANNSFSKVMDRLNNFHSIGLFVPNSVLSRDVIGNLVDLENELPATTIYKLRNECKHLGNLSNIMLQSLLNKEDEKNMMAATNYMLNGRNTTKLFPGQWSQSLVRSYLPTGLLDDLVTFLWYASRDSNTDDVEIVFRGLTCVPAVLHRFQIDMDVEVHLRKILTALVEHKVGLPKKTGDELLAQKPGLKSLVEEAVSVWEDGVEYWTPEREAEFLKQRKTLHLRNSPGPARQFPSMPYIGEYTQVDGSLQDMENAQQRLVTLGKVNNSLVSNLIEAYSDNNQPEKALKVLEYGQSNGSFSCHLISGDKLVRSLARNGKREEALVMMDKFLETGDSPKETKVFGSTFFDVLASLAEAGDHQKIMDLLNNHTPNQFIKGGSQSTILCSIYSKAGEMEKLEALYKTLAANNWIKNDNRSLGLFVKMHMDNGNLEAALEEMGRIRKEHNIMPRKFELTNRLIENEDLEMLQKVLDLSIEHIGEERSLYDLAFCFLNMGRTAQAKKLLETPGIRYQKDKLTYMIETFRKNGKRDAVESLVSLSKGIFECDRDYLFHQLVKTFEDDPDRIQEVWMKIQEEGHAPSDSLKIAIAKALEAGGKSVPFEVPREYVSKIPEAEIVVKEGVTKGESIKPTKSKADKSERTPKVNGPEDDIIAAFTKKDFTTANDLIKAALENKTMKKSRIIGMLEKCLEIDFAEGAKISAFIQNSCSNELYRGILSRDIVRRHTSSLMQKFAVNNDMQGCQEFFDSINDDQKKYLTLTLEQIKLNILWINDEPAYLDMVRKDPIEGNFGIWTVPASLVAQARPEFIAEMKNLAKENNVTAQYVLGRSGMGRNDDELVKESWGLVQDKARLAHHFFSIPNETDIKLISETLKENELAEAMKTFLSNSKKYYKLRVVVEMATILSNNAGSLEDLHTNTLRSLSNSKEFKEKALEILKSREESASS